MTLMNIRLCSALGVALGGSHRQQHMQTHPRASHTAPACCSQITAGSDIFRINSGQKSVLDCMCVLTVEDREGEYTKNRRCFYLI